MYIDLQPIFDKYNIHPKGVVHVGAHWAEEHEDYMKWGIERFVYIEPCEKAFDILRKKFGVFGNGDIINIGDDIFGIKMFKCACGSFEKENAPMYVSHQNQGQSNSLLRPELHLLQHPEVVFNDAEVIKLVTLDSIPIDKQKYDMLVMDVQGYEGEVLKGAEDTLRNINIIYSEINRGQTYSMNMEVDELDELLAREGFIRVETFWPSENLTWGDAVYIKK
jgi:FkbM family methyltransferase